MISAACQVVGEYALISQAFGSLNECSDKSIPNLRCALCVIAFGAPSAIWEERRLPRAIVQVCQQRLDCAAEFGKYGVDGFTPAGDSEVREGYDGGGKRYELP